MRIALVIVFLAASAFAQSAAPACGPDETDFEIKLDKSQHVLTQPEPGKARVYFIQDLGRLSCLGACVKTKIGVDGTWVGAIRHNSYFSISVKPGEHHLCAKTSQDLALVHLNAEAGKVYYFRAREFGDNNQVLFDFEPVDSDQAQHLIATFSLSISHPKQE